MAWHARSRWLRCAAGVSVRKTQIVWKGCAQSARAAAQLCCRRGQPPPPLATQPARLTVLGPIGCFTLVTNWRSRTFLHTHTHAQGRQCRVTGLSFVQLYRSWACADGRALQGPETPQGRRWACSRGTRVQEESAAPQPAGSPHHHTALHHHRQHAHPTTTWRCQGDSEMLVSPRDFSKSTKKSEWEDKKRHQNCSGVQGRSNSCRRGGGFRGSGHENCSGLQDRSNSCGRGEGLGVQGTRTAEACRTGRTLAGVEEGGWVSARFSGRRATGGRMGRAGQVTFPWEAC